MSNNSLLKGLEDIPALGQCDAEELADIIIDAVIDALMHDPAAPKYTALDWRIVLAPAHALVVARINMRITDHIARQDALNAVEWEG